MRALDTAATGMAAMDLKVQVIAGNIANMSTTGFKSQRAEFQDLIYEHVQRVGAQASDQGNILPVGIELGSGVKTVGTPRLMTQGTLSQTGITIPQNASGLTITSQGQVSVTLPGSTTSTVLGQLTLTRFTNNAGLQANGDNMYTATPASGTPQDTLPATEGAG